MVLNQTSVTEELFIRQVALSLTSRVMQIIIWLAATTDHLLSLHLLKHLKVRHRSQVIVFLQVCENKQRVVGLGRAVHP